MFIYDWTLQFARFLRAFLRGIPVQYSGPDFFLTNIQLINFDGTEHFYPPVIPVVFCLWFNESAPSAFSV
ncbi:hypothetical protein CS542_07925 [Pedobacter sp. IW39]|nr:hypothetical protein CS542_07925 [Pedobacter sp. IW39]